MKRYWSTVVAIACVTVMGSSLAYGSGNAAAGQSPLCVGGVRGRLVDGWPAADDANASSSSSSTGCICLVALGRTAEAEKVIASVVVENPTFVPDAGETSPRIQGMFQRIRRGLVPEIAQRMYLEARAAWNRKDTAAAAGAVRGAGGFDRQRRQNRRRGPVERGEAEPMLSELRLLASGFLDLSRALSDAYRAANADASTPAAPTPGQRRTASWTSPRRCQ